jgi:hypothetical protein
MDPSSKLEDLLTELKSRNLLEDPLQYTIMESGAVLSNKDVIEETIQDMATVDVRSSLEYKDDQERPLKMAKTCS